MPISIALERQGQLVAGVIYNPAMDELYTAERGGGAFLNDRRLRVAARSKLSDAVIGTGMPHLGRGQHGNYLIELRHVMGEVAGVRRLGSAALDLAYVAAGRMDGFWEERLSAWDIAAGILMIREAGGFVTDPDGGQEMLDKGAADRRQRGHPSTFVEGAEGPPALAIAPRASHLGRVMPWPPQIGEPPLHDNAGSAEDRTVPFIGRFVIKPRRTRRGRHRARHGRRRGAGGRRRAVVGRDRSHRSR